ncbi:phage major tropism determinant, partial [Bartonella gabonensis]|uniref:phage major tropism determinant n=1 Tax=Bartonella gabonensis TaxID=2699889 RepID=UPI001FECAD84
MAKVYLTSSWDLERKAYQAKSEAEKAKETADRAKRTAEEAQKAAETADKKASSLASSLEDKLEETEKTAKAAKEKAGYAEHDARQARNEVEKIKSTANQAWSKAYEAKEVADRAKRTAEEAKTTADTTKKELGGIKSSLATAAQTTATTAHTVATQAKNLAEKINTFLKQSNLTALSVSTPFLVATGKAQLTVKKGTYLTLQRTHDILVASYTADSRIGMPSLSAGKDYYLYLVPEGDSHKIVVSENSTYPRDYIFSSSRKIGGFHTLCADVGTISGHPLSGYRAGDILPNSVWCLNHRPYSSPEGMVYDPSTDLWVD